jgi:dTDP-4-amino-4,6-dideoxygalactose transaminase
MERVQEVLRSKWLTMGEVTARFEKAFAEYIGVPYCFAVCNGTAALHLAVAALDIGPGDEVICPSLTFVATANAIIYSGATPVFTDITGKNDLNISSASIESNINERTKAIMVMHYGGFPCALDEIMDIASKHGLKVIEDAAHAPGAEFIEKRSEGNAPSLLKIGGIGDVGCFSFFSNKNLSVGEGGMIVTRDKRLAEKIRSMRSHGMTSLTLDRYRGHSYTYDVTELGYNYRIDEIRAALGIVQLERLTNNNRRRKALDALYRERLQNVRGIEIPFGDFTHNSAHHIFPILLSKDIDRMTFMEKLRNRGIQTSIHYPSVHQFTYYRKLLSAKDADLPITEYVGGHEVTLPLYPSLKEEDIEYIVSGVKDTLNQVRRL